MWLEVVQCAFSEGPVGPWVERRAARAQFSGNVATFAEQVSAARGLNDRFAMALGNFVP